MDILSCLPTNHGWRVVIGGFLAHLVLGTLYLWASITPAVTAYLRGYDPSLTYHDTIMVYASALGSQGIFMLVGGVLERAIGPRLTMILGGSVLCLGTLLCASVTSLAGFIWFNGIFFGVGMGIVYTAPITCAIRWLPKEKGRVTGSIVAGFGGGSLIFNQVALHVLNPENERPDVVEESGVYFQSDSDVARRVPRLYVLLGCLYAVLFAVGVALTRDPTKDEAHLISSHASSSPLSSSSSSSLPQPTGSTPNGSDYGGRKVMMTVSTTDDEVGNEDKEGVTRVGIELSSHELGGGGFYDGEVHVSGIPLSPHAQRGLTPTTDMGPFEIMRSVVAWHLAISFFLTTTGGMYFAGTFKTYGLNFIPDDVLLTNLATLSSAFNAGGRFVWGYLGDRYGHATTLVYMATCFGLIQLTYPLALTMGATGFCTWTLMLFVFEGGNFCLYVPILVQLFGIKNSAANYGVVFTIYSVLNVSFISILSSCHATFGEAATFCSTVCFVGVFSVVFLSWRAGWDIHGLEHLLKQLDACA